MVLQELTGTPLSVSMSRENKKLALDALSPHQGTVTKGLQFPDMKL